MHIYESSGTFGVITGQIRVKSDLASVRGSSEVKVKHVSIAQVIELGELIPTIPKSTPKSTHKWWKWSKSGQKCPKMAKNGINR